MLMALALRSGGGERQLRSWLRHEQQTVAMALAEKFHRSAQRRVEPHNVPPEPTKASAREGEVREECDILPEDPRDAAGTSV